MTPRKRGGREAGERIERDEMLRLVPGHELHRLVRRDDRAVEGEEQRRKKTKLRETNENCYCGHDGSKSKRA